MGGSWGKLSSQLRTRLTYALLKVRNDWTTESLEQIENRIRSGQSAGSPRKREDRRHARTASEPGVVPHPLSQASMPGGADEENRTYEAFWREHEVNPLTRKILQQRGIEGRGNLAPPAQIIPDRERRTGFNPNRHIPSLVHQGSSGAAFIPNTPPHSQTADAQRTMEQDAVESLMFLSSPGNSQHMRRGSLSQAIDSNASSQTHVMESPAPSSQQSRDGYSYSRSTSTWPRSRRGFKQQRTSLGQIGMMDSGVGFDAEVTDEEQDDQYLKPPSSQYVKH